TKQSFTKITIPNGLKKDQPLFREELYLAGVGSPPYANTAHHIVAINDSNPNAVKSRDILAKYKIDLNSAANGVFLPYKKNEFVGITSYHWGRHNNDYYKEVYEKLKKAYDILVMNNMYKEGDEKSRQICVEHICKTLNELRGELLNGQLKVNGYIPISQSQFDDKDIIE
ncbi:MAG: AHH domain-containing protein, partial [Ruminococcus sp.]|nr:AHH domain-containing protein [Ruminococcus sp.]